MTATPKGQISRDGVVSFFEAGISITDSVHKLDGNKIISTQFKCDVFARVIQTLNRIGWLVTSWENAKEYPSIAGNRRSYSKGHLKGELRLEKQGIIQLKMWQDANTPTRPDYGGRYEPDLEGCMPYLIRMEMERTRQRISRYLCSVFDGYVFEESKTYRRAGKQTAWEKIQHRYQESGHFNGADWDEFKNRSGMSYNLLAGDGTILNHGQRVWITDNKGRWRTGVAYYNINNMWWVLLGKFDYANKAADELRTTPPPDIRKKENERLRTHRLSGLMSQCVESMDFERAAILRDVLFPKGEPLFYLIKNGKYFRPGKCGYTSNACEAGKFTAQEINSYATDFVNGEIIAKPLKKS